MSLGSRYDVKPSGTSSSGYPTPPAPSGGGGRIGAGRDIDDGDNLVAWNPRNDGNQAHHIYLSPGSSKRGGGGRSSMGSAHSQPRGPSVSGGVELFAGGGSNAGDTVDELETLGSIHYSLSRLYEEMNGQDFDKFIAEIESFDMPVERFRPWLKNESLKKALKDSTQQTTPRPGGVSTPAAGGGSGANGNAVTAGAGSAATHNAASGGSAPGTPRSTNAGVTSSSAAPGGSWDSFATRHKPRLHGGAPRGNTEDMQQLLEEEGQMLAPVRSESIAPETSGRDFNCATASFISRQYEELNRKDIIIEELQIRNGFVMRFSHASHAALQAERMQAERHLLEKCNFLETNQEESRSIATGGILDIEAAARTKMERLQDEVLRELSKEMVRMQVVTKATHDSSKLSWIDMHEERARHNLILDADRTLHYIFSDHFTALHDFMLNLRHHNSRPQNYYEGINPYTITDPRDPMQGIEENRNNQSASGHNKSGEYPRGNNTPRTPRGGGGGDADQHGGRTSGNTSARRHRTPNPTSGIPSLPQRGEFIDGLLNKNVANKQQDMLNDAEGPAKERMDASLDERHKKRDEVRRRQAAAEEAALKRKEAAQKRKDFQNRRENDISMALGSSRATPKSAQKRSGSPRSLTSGADGSSSLDGSHSNVPISTMLARRVAAAKKTPDQIVQEADDFTDDNTTHTNGALSTARSGGASASGHYTNRHGGGAMSGSGGGNDTARDSDVDPWAASIGRKALADLAQFPPFYGWLYKSQGVLMSWQRRYFVLTRTGKIKYTTQDPTVEGANVKWILLLHAEDITRVEVDMFQDSSAGVRPPVDQYHSNCFYVDAVSNHDDHDAKGRPRRFKFCCRNKTEMTRWMLNLRKATDVVYTLEESGLVPRSPVREHFRKMFALLSPLLAGGGVMSGNGEGEGDEIPAYRRRVQMEDDIAALEVQQRESDERERRQDEEDRRLGQLSPTRRGRSASPAPARSTTIDA